MTRRPAVLAVIAAVVLAVVPASCGGSGGGSGDEGSTLPDVDLFALASEGDDPVSLSDLDGPAVINLWATWCAPCRREIPAFEAVHQARGDEVRFIGVNVGDDADDASAFLADVGATYDQFLDPEGYVSTELGTTTMPITLVIDADGVVSTRHLGEMSAEELDAAIDQALAAA